MHGRTLNFLANWIDANIVHASGSPEPDPALMKPRFLTDAVAAGLTLDDVKDDWETAARQIEAALEARRHGPA